MYSPVFWTKIYVLSMICAFVKGVFSALEIFTPFYILINNLVVGLEVSYGVTMVFVEYSISLGGMVPYESYRLFIS